MSKIKIILFGMLAVGSILVITIFSTYTTGEKNVVFY